MDFIPYKSHETLEHKYYQIPQELFVNEKYKNKLNSDSKILYAFLCKRLMKRRIETSSKVLYN